MTISKARLAGRVQLRSKGPSLNIPKLQLGNRNLNDHGSTCIHQLPMTTRFTKIMLRGNASTQTHHASTQTHRGPKLHPCRNVGFKVKFDRKQQDVRL
jgi:hypothetical protein